MRLTPAPKGYSAVTGPPLHPGMWWVLRWLCGRLSHLLPARVHAGLVCSRGSQTCRLMLSLSWVKSKSRQEPRASTSRQGCWAVLRAALLSGTDPAESVAAPTPVGLPGAFTQPCVSPHLRPPRSVHRAPSQGSGDLGYGGLCLQSPWAPSGVRSSAFPPVQWGEAHPTCRLSAAAIAVAEVFPACILPSVGPYSVVIMSCVFIVLPTCMVCPSAGNMLSVCWSGAVGTEQGSAGARWCPAWSSGPVLGCADRTAPSG